MSTTPRIAAQAAEEKESLWALVAAPAVWAVHFLASYVTAAIWCAKLADPSAPLGPARVAIFAYTGLALGAVALLGGRGFTRYRRGRGAATHDQPPSKLDSSLSRHRFLGLAAWLLSLLSAVAILYAAAAVLLIEDCR